MLVCCSLLCVIQKKQAICELGIEDPSTRLDFKIDLIVKEATQYCPLANILCVTSDLFCNVISSVTMLQALLREKLSVY